MVVATEGARGAEVRGAEARGAPVCKTEGVIPAEGVEVDAVVEGGTSEDKFGATVEGKGVFDVKLAEGRDGRLPESVEDILNADTVFDGIPFEVEAPDAVD